MKRREPWEVLAIHLRESLAGDVTTGEPTIEAEEEFEIGATSVDIVVESAGASEASQVLGFGTICDLLRTRLHQGKDQVLGCLLIDGEPSASAFASGLDGMQFENDFTPVIPLPRSRAKEMVDAGAPLFEFVDRSTQLIRQAAAATPTTEDIAATVLVEIDELIERALGKPL